MPKLLRRIILELDEHKEANGHSEAILRLLDCDDTSGEKLIWGIGELKRKTRMEEFMISRLPHRKLEWCNVFCFDTFDGSRGANTTSNLLFDEEIPTRARSWVGFLTVVDQQPIIQGFVILANPWTYNAELEKLVATLPSSHGQTTD